MYIYIIYTIYNLYIYIRKITEIIIYGNTIYKAGVYSSVTEFLPSTAEAPIIKHQHDKNKRCFIYFFKNSVSLFTFTV